MIRFSKASETTSAPKPKAADSDDVDAIVEKPASASPKKPRKASSKTVAKSDEDRLL